jgi:hypothetical protein
MDVYYKSKLSPTIPLKWQFIAHFDGRREMAYVLNRRELLYLVVPASRLGISNLSYFENSTL